MTDRKDRIMHKSFHAMKLPDGRTKPSISHKSKSTGNNTV